MPQCQNESTCKTIHLKMCTGRLFLKQRHKVTRKFLFYSSVVMFSHAWLNYERLRPGPVPDHSCVTKQSKLISLGFRTASKIKKNETCSQLTSFFYNVYSVPLLERSQESVWFPCQLTCNFNIPYLEIGSTWYAVVCSGISGFSEYSAQPSVNAR